jgi:UDP-N-acetylglucosamine 3-dehydrogenase
MMRILVCGVGDFGRLHAELVRDHRETELVGVVDVSPERGAAVGGGEVPAFTELGDGLETTRPDGVIVATPEHVHASDGIMALRAGCHVLVEKPVTLDLDELDLLAAVAEQAGRTVLPGHVSRFVPEIADALHRNEPPRYLSASRYVPQVRRGPHGRIHPAWMAMIHDLDLIAGFLPDRAEITITAGQRRTAGAGQNPDVCAGLLEVADGPLVTVENVWLWPHERQYIEARLRIAYDDAVLDLRMPGDTSVLVTADGEYRPSVAIDGRVSHRPVGALALQLGHFVDLAAGRTPPLVTLRDARRAGVLADGVVRAAERGQPVEVLLT